MLDQPVPVSYRRRVVDGSLVSYVEDVCAIVVSRNRYLRGSEEGKSLPTCQRHRPSSRRVHRPEVER